MQGECQPLPGENRKINRPSLQRESQPDGTMCILYATDQNGPISYHYTDARKQAEDMRVSQVQAR